MLVDSEIVPFRHGSIERERSSPVMLSAAKHLVAHRNKPFAICIIMLDSAIKMPKQGDPGAKT